MNVNLPKTTSITSQLFKHATSYPPSNAYFKYWKIVILCVCCAAAHMQETTLERTAFLGRIGDTAGEAECYTSVLRNTVRGK